MPTAGARLGPKKWTDLSQTHFVGQDTVDTLFIQITKPCKTFELVLFQLSHEHLWLSDRYRILTKRRILEIELVPVDCDISALPCLL